MQTFQSRFTTDISQHQRTMGMFREQTCAAVRQARTELLSLGAVSIGSKKTDDALFDRRQKLNGKKEGGKDPAEFP